MITSTLNTSSNGIKDNIEKNLQMQIENFYNMVEQLQVFLSMFILSLTTIKAF